MMLVKWWFLLVVIPAMEGSLRIWKPNGFSREETVMKKIQETCYADNDFKALIFILGDFYGVFDKASVIRMETLWNVNPKYGSGQLSSIGVTKVLMIEDSPEKLHSDLLLLKKSRWWNHMLPFFIIGKDDESCGNFKEILNATWKMDLLNSIYICSESENTTLYTLNPITNYAPDPWRRIKDFNDSNIYHQVFDPHTSCNSLNYDKTKVLNGYKIKIFEQSTSEKWNKEDLKNAFSKLVGPRLFYLVIKQLNASFINKQSNDSSSLLHFDENNADITYFSDLAVINHPFLELFPLKRESQHVVLVKTNERTVLYKIRHLWSTQVLCVAAIALIILFFILAMKSNDITSATLDVMRFLTYVSIRTNTRNNSFRIYFATMLIFIVISNGVFQGRIASFLTKPDKVLPIETIEELTNLEYHFYVLRQSFKKLSSWMESADWKLREQSKLNPMLKSVDNVDACIDYVLNGTLNACIIPLDLYGKKHRLKPLDRLRSRLDIVDSFNWISRRNWPLYARFNYMLLRSIESGIYANWEDEDYYRMKEKRKADDLESVLEEIQPPYRPIELAKLDFAFDLLVIGLQFATIVLIIELRIREI